ncbi:hypothetical protein B0H14DRAFT_3481577 [Mycena olivaceomarginata]|nr:hypothetical protein B0H14DRAFT_3481577 [Mycena olivaceomarginata]
MPPMPPTLPPTNMTAEEMIPDTVNPAHDPKFWCLPPVHDQPSERQKNRFPMYLVTQGRAVGVWHNWTVVKAMVNGQSAATLCAGCSPTPTGPTSQSIRSIGAAPEAESRGSVSPLPPSTTTLVSSTSSITAATWAGVPEVVRSFAIWGGRIVYADRIHGSAREAFLEAESEGTKPRILSTSDYDEVQAFSESTYWI